MPILASNLFIDTQKKILDYDPLSYLATDEGSGLVARDLANPSSYGAYSEYGVFYQFPGMFNNIRNAVALDGYQGMLTLPTTFLPATVGNSFSFLLAFEMLGSRTKEMNIISFTDGTNEITVSKPENEQFLRVAYGSGVLDGPQLQNGDTLFFLTVSVDAAGYINVFINGEPYASTSFTPDTWVPEVAICGARKVGTDYIGHSRIAITNPAFFDRVLTPRDVKVIYYQTLDADKPGSGAVAFGGLSGDVNAAAGTGTVTATLATTGVTAGTTVATGAAIPTITVDAKGRVLSYGSVPLSATGVGEVTIGDASHSVTLHIGADGRVISASSVAITGVTPATHATSHQDGGSDKIALDTLAAPTDNTNLNVSTSAHGLMKKLPGTSGIYFDGSGAFTAITAAQTTFDTPGGMSADNVQSAIEEINTAKVSTTTVINTTAPIVGGGDLSEDRTISMPAADSETDGYLTATSYNIFNSKQSAGNYITSTTGDVTTYGVVDGVAELILADVGSLSPGTYGSATEIPVITVDSKGRVTSVTTETASGGGGGGDYTLPAAGIALGGVKMYTAYIGNGSSTSIMVMHGLSRTTILAVCVFDSATGVKEIEDVVDTTADTMQFNFAVAPVTNGKKVVIVAV